MRKLTKKRFSHTRTSPITQKCFSHPKMPQSLKNASVTQKCLSHSKNASSHPRMHSITQKCLSHAKMPPVT